MKAQSSHPEREVRAGVRSVPGFSECCPTTLHLHTDCRVCQLYFYGPPKPLTKDSSSSSGIRSANPKAHPLYSRKISAPEERHRQRRPARQRILSTSQLPEPPTFSTSQLPEPPISFSSRQHPESSISCSSRQHPSQCCQASALPDFQDDPSLRPLSADALDEGRRQEEAATRREERFMAEQIRERKEVGVRRSVSFAGQRRTYQY